MSATAATLRLKSALKSDKENAGVPFSFGRDSDSEADYTQDANWKFPAIYNQASKFDNKCMSTQRQGQKLRGLNLEDYDVVSRDHLNLKNVQVSAFSLGECDDARQYQELITSKKKLEVGKEGKVSISDTHEEEK